MESDSIEYVESSLLSLVINQADTELFLKIYNDLDLHSSDFISAFHKRVYEILTELVVTKSLHIDKALIYNKLSSGKLQKHFDALINVPTSIDNIIPYVEEIKNSSKKRNLKSILLEASMSLNENDANAQTIIANMEDSLVKVVSSAKIDFFDPKDIVPRIIEEMKSGKKKINMSTSFDRLDDMIRGFQPGYIILAGRPSMGKTELGLQFCVHNAERGKRIAVFSLEMDETIMMCRILAYVSEIPLTSILNASLDNQELQLFQAAVDKVLSMPIHIDPAAGCSASQIAAKAKRLKIKYPDLSMIMIDYIGLISGNDENSEHSEITKISKTLKILSRTLGIPVIALSQLSRAVESREDKRPKLSDLRSSGSLEQDADIIIFLFSEQYGNYDDTNKNNMLTEIIVGKNRNGPTGTIMATNVKKIQKFKEIKGS